MDKEEYKQVLADIGIDIPDEWDMNSGAKAQEQVTSKNDFVFASLTERVMIEAYNLVLAGDVDIIFTDWNMPVMDGLTFVIELRKTSKVPIVMVTTEGGQKEVLEAMKSGVNDYIVKPFTPSVLISKLETHVKK